MRGTTDRGVHGFKGIPYGAPPSGTRRFPVRCRGERLGDGVRDTTALSGPSCAQPAPGVTPGPAREAIGSTSHGDLRVPRRGARRQRGLSGTERVDCGTAADVRISDDGAPSPVMVRIHGGGFTMGSGSWSAHDGGNLVRRGDVVVVTVNHRLGILGYLDLSLRFGAELADSGNVGMLDLVSRSSRSRQHQCVWRRSRQRHRSSASRVVATR